MTDKQHPALFDWATELLDTQGHITLSAQEAHEIGARLRSMGEKLNAYEDLDEAASDVQLLRMGYAAARLEIESLQARIKTMAEEHADELMVAHLDGRMRAAQPAGAQAAPELTETAVTAKNPAAPVSSFEDSRTQAVYEVLVNDNYPPAGSNEHWEGWKARLIVDALFPIEAPAAVAGPSEFPHEQMDVMALARYKVMPSHESMLHRHVVVAGDGSQQLYIGREVECENMARKFAGAFLDGAFAFHSMLAAAPTPPTQATDSVLEDAARLDWLALAGPTSICVVIDREHDGEVEVSTDDVTGYGKTLREALDKARKQGASHD